MATYLHIFIKPKAGINAEKVKEMMDLAVDWYKYSDYCWVVKTTSDVNKWQTRLKPLVEPDGTLLILAIDPSNRQGWIAKAFWDWIK
jgi:hypothetical protein